MSPLNLLCMMLFIPAHQCFLVFFVMLSYHPDLQQSVQNVRIMMLWLCAAISHCHLHAQVQSLALLLAAPATGKNRPLDEDELQFLDSLAEQESAAYRAQLEHENAEIESYRRVGP